MESLACPTENVRLLKLLARRSSKVSALESEQELIPALIPEMSCLSARLYRLSDQLLLGLKKSASVSACPFFSGVRTWLSAGVELLSEFGPGPLSESVLGALAEPMLGEGELEPLPCAEDEAPVVDVSKGGAGAVTVIVGDSWGDPPQLLRTHAVPITNTNFIVRLIIGSPFPSIYAHLRQFLEAYMTKLTGRFGRSDCDEQCFSELLCSGVSFLFQPMVEMLARVFAILRPAPVKPDAAGLRVRPVFRDRCARMER